MTDNQFLQVRKSPDGVEFVLVERGRKHVDRHPDYLLPYIWREQPIFASYTVNGRILSEIVETSQFIEFFDEVNRLLLGTMQLHKKRYTIFN